MKTYEIRIGSVEGENLSTLNDRTYARLSDSIAELKNVLNAMQSDPASLDDDKSLWIVRTSGKKGSPAVETNIVQMVCGNDEDSGEFCYEGIYYLSKCSDFERMILVGERKGSWIGEYSVQIASNTVNELCFFSDLEMILESVKDLREDPDQIRNRLMTIFRRENDKDAKSIALLLYTLNPDGTLKMQSRLDVNEEDRDFAMLMDFVRAEQDEEHEEEPSADSEVEAVSVPEDIEAVESAQTGE